MSFGRRFFKSSGLALLILGYSAEAFAEKLTLPQNPQQWINSSPLTNEMLSGKAVVLWFFEEQCPNCEGRWPELLKAASSFEGQPVLFAAVNSGTSRAEIEDYVSRNKITWPVILDPDRSLEKQAEVGEISLKNVSQVVIIRGDGSETFGDWRDLEKSGKEAVATGKWKVDPSTIPDLLKQAWQQVEFGNYPAAAGLIRKNLKTTKSDVKAAAESLLAVVTGELQADIDRAKQANSDGKKWEAFKTIQSLSLRFKGYDIPPEVATQLKELAADSEIKTQLAAAKAWELTKKNAMKSPKLARKQLELFLKQYPTAEAATEAQAMLNDIKGQ